MTTDNDHQRELTPPARTSTGSPLPLRHTIQDTQSQGKASDHGSINDDETPQYTNRLIHETSPYLLQHAHNPVDWYPWGKEALEKAQSEDKPIFLSIGYSACHWCHLLVVNSFENEDTARLMNELYVSIKVDREERPDLDALYMEAVQALTGSGGWPMTVFLTPDGAPFYGGTYFPPQDRYGMPSFTRVLRGVADLYRNQREDVEKQAEAFREHYAEQAQTGLKLPDDFNPATATISAETLTAAANVLVSQFDAVEGGFGPAPKFPHPMGAGVPAAHRGAEKGERRERVALQPARRAPAAADAVDAGQNGGGRDIRSGGRRLPPLLDRQDLADAALREDALRQRAARAGLPARLAAHR